MLSYFVKFMYLFDVHLVIFEYRSAVVGESPKFGIFMKHILT